MRRASIHPAQSANPQQCKSVEYVVTLRRTLPVHCGGSGVFTFEPVLLVKAHARPALLYEKSRPAAE
jgi:hypothetical protein